MSKTFSKILTKIFDVSFSSTFFVLSRFRVFLSDGSSKTLQKTFCKKNRVEKFLQKIRPKIQNRRLLDFFFNHVFGRFSVRGVQKHDKNIFAKSPCRKLFPRKFSENQQKFRYQFFLDFFGFIAFLGAS